jgi:putative zinc finger/helix-turn-helix YgiT family protein
VDDTRNTLAEIARLGRYSSTRRQEFSPSSPCEWSPHVIVDPETGLPFLDASAWQLICRKLEESPESFREVRLRKPPGQIAFETVLTLPSKDCVYIKVQLFQGKAHGRSFHRSTKEWEMVQDTSRVHDSKELCIECGSARLVERQKEQSFAYGPPGDQVTLTASMPVMTCEDCGYESFDQRGDAARQAAVCRHLGVQTPDEVRRTREGAGLSRAEFCQLTGFGQASLQRWESGMVVPNASSDRLIFLLRCPDNVERLQKRAVALNQESPSSPPQDADRRGLVCRT